MWCSRRHHASPAFSLLSWHGSVGSMGVLCLGGNRVWEAHLYGYICFLFIVVDLTSGASPLFWYLLLRRLLFIFVINLTSGSSPSSWDLLNERFLLTFACHEFMAYWKVWKYLNFGFLSYVYFRPLTLTCLNYFPLGLLVLNAQIAGSV